MSNTVHKRELSHKVTDIMSNIDLLPLHTRFKVQLYIRYALPKISWHLTVADLTKIWVSKNLDNLIVKYFRSLLDLPILGKLSYVSSSKANTLLSFTKTERISYLKSTFSALSSNKIFKILTWIPQFAPPQMPFNLASPSYQQVSNVIRKMKSSGLPSPFDQISILCFKRCPYLRSHLTEIICAVWLSGEVPCHWKKACTILGHKTGATKDPANFRPITLEAVPLKVFTSCLRNSIYHFLVQNIYIECNIQRASPLSSLAHLNTHLKWLI